MLVAGIVVSDLFSLKGKVAFITGARRGIGAATAQLFAEAGADLVLCDPDVASGELSSLTQKIRQAGRRVISLKADGSQKDDVENAVTLALDELGHIDALVNNVVLGKPGPAGDTAAPDWEEAVNANLRGCYLCCQAVARHMAGRRSGHIVNIASIEGMIAVRDQAGLYAVSKAGIVEMTRSLARELARCSVHVNGITPGYLRVQMPQYVQREPARMRLMETRALKARVGEADDIAAVALFLSTPASMWVDGEIMVVDGGALA